MERIKERQDKKSIDESDRQMQKDKETVTKRKDKRDRDKERALNTKTDKKTEREIKRKKRASHILGPRVTRSDKGK
jgi:hypothetical protein